jgi:hypothetical protein
LKLEEEAVQKALEEELIAKQKEFQSTLNKISMESSTPAKIKTKAKENLK